MICKSCGAENENVRFCTECGAPLEQEEIAVPPEIAQEQPQETERLEESDGAAENFSTLPEDFEELPPLPDQPWEEEPFPLPAEEGSESEEYGEPKSAEVREALENLEKYEAGTITHPSEKPKEKRSFWCPKNPVLWSFLWLLGFGALLGGLTALFFAIDIEGTQIIFGIVFAVFTAAVLGIDFAYYLPAAFTLDRLFKGKGVKLEYRLKDYELVEQAEKAKKRNRGFYVAIGLFGLAFTIYYIYILATAIVQTKLMWISLAFSICVFIICGLLFFIMPKFNYMRMMQGGKRVIIGESSVYYGGNYYHWSSIQPEATLANVNSRKHELQLTFLQVFKNGRTQRRRLDVYLPDRELGNAANLAKAFEVTAKAYHEKQLQISILSENRDKDGNKKKK